MKLAFILVLFLSAACIAECQNQRRGNRRSQGGSSGGGILDTVTNTLFPGSSDTPVLTRVFNKFSYYLSGIVVTVVGYFAFFRNRKRRNETINAFLGEWQEKMALSTGPTDKKTADKTIYELNFRSDLKVQMRSSNERVSQNVQVKVKEADEDSPNLYKVIFQGTDPEGNSLLEGYAAFAGDKMQIAMAQTHDKYTKKEQSPIYYFEGCQEEGQQLALTGEWWVQGQKGTKGDYSGNWKLLL